MKRSVIFFFAGIYFFLFFSNPVQGQQETFDWIKPVAPKTKNYKKARQLYKKATIEATHLFMDYEAAKKLFKGRKSGIAIESIPVSDVLAKPFWQDKYFSNKADMDQIAGKITFFTNGKSLLRTAKSNAIKWENLRIFGKKTKIRLHPKTFSYLIPAASVDTIRNLVIVRKGRVCKIEPLLHSPGTLFISEFPDIGFQFSKNVMDKPDKPSQILTRDTIEFKVYFKRGEAEPLPAGQKRLSELIDTLCADIKAVNAVGFASVEGKYEINRQLYIDRTKNIKSMFDSCSAAPYPFSLKAMENWSFFREQIKGTDYEYLSGRNRENVRKFVNEHLEDSVISAMLDGQRYVYVEIIFEKPLQDTLYSDNPEDWYNNLIKYAESTHLKGQPDIINKLETLQVYLYNQCLNEKLPCDRIARLPVPSGSEFGVLQVNKLIFTYLMNKKRYTEKWLFDKLLALGLDKSTRSSAKNVISFNTQLMLFKAVSDGTLSFFINTDLLENRSYRDRIFKLIPVSTSKSKTIDIPQRLVMQYMRSFIERNKKDRLTALVTEDLYRYYYTWMTYSYVTNFYPETEKKAIRFFKGMTKYYTDEKIRNDEERLAVAREYMYFNQYEKGLHILSPLIHRDSPDEQAIMLGISCKQFLLDEEDLIDEILNSRYELGYNLWVEMLKKPGLLGPRYFDYSVIREYYITN